MALIDGIQARIRAGRFEFSEHAVNQSLNREIDVFELVEAIESGEVVEDYPDDKYGPSCLIFGRTVVGRPLHVQTSYPTRDRIKIITLYEPDPAKWVDFRKRRE